MQFQKFKPSKNFKNIIASYWIIQNANQDELQRVLPDGYIDIIFNLGNDIFSNNKVESSIPKNCIAITGMMTKYSDVLLGSNSYLLGIGFKPGQLSKLTNHPLDEIKNKIIDAPDIIPELNGEKLEQIAEQKDIKNKINSIEIILSKILSAKKLPNDSLIFSVTDFILTSSEPLNISEIAENHHISLRQLERRFKSKIGLTLIEFSNTIRFAQTIKSIAQNPNKSLLSIAFDNGYYDHSHLTNEIKKFSGKIPSDFR